MCFPGVERGGCLDEREVKEAQGARKTYAAFLRELHARNRGGKSYLYCPVRRSWHLSTPEEKVRQHCLYHLLYERGYPASLIAVERQLERTHREQKQHRIDILVYDRHSKPYVLIECKRQETALGGLSSAHLSQHFEQLLAYNRVLQAHYLALFDGDTCLLMDTRRHTRHTVFPPYASSRVGED